jgi:hypothetical protein
MARYKKEKKSFLLPAGPFFIFPRAVRRRRRRRPFVSFHVNRERWPPFEMFPLTTNSTIFQWHLIVILVKQQGRGIWASFAMGKRKWTDDKH